MPALLVFVDYDNVELNLTKAGPVNLAKALASLIPEAVISRHDEIIVRLYGGWRTHGTLTKHAQRLIPDIRSASPLVVGARRAGTTVPLKLSVELADKPLNSTVPLSETLVRERSIRKFRIRGTPWPECSSPTSCGLNQLVGVTYATPCKNGACINRLGDLFVRDEQKMVDTLIVADIAYQALSRKASDIAIVSSDTDMWPGVLLAVQAGCNVTHIHTRSGWRTQRHLMGTLGAQMNRHYQQLSV